MPLTLVPSAVLGLFHKADMSVYYGSDALSIYGIEQALSNGLNDENEIRQCLHEQLSSGDPSRQKEGNDGIVVQQMVELTTPNDRLTFPFPCSGMFFSPTTMMVIIIRIIVVVVILVLVLVFLVLSTTGVIGVASPLT